MDPDPAAACRTLSGMPDPDEQTEPDDAGADHAVPDDLLVLHQVIEWAEATR